jgi:hypothetical protein
MKLVAVDIDLFQMVGTARFDNGTVVAIKGSVECQKYVEATKYADVVEWQTR